MTKIIWPILLLGITIGCKGKTEDKTVGPDQSSNVIRNEVLPPTNPNGGAVEGKSEAMDPEEALRRKTLNVIQPIVWGESLAGITMSTTFEEAQSILSNVVGSTGFFTFYAEHLAVAWTGAEPNVPFAIVALDGYAGTLSLPAPFGNVKIGDDVSGLLQGSYGDRQNLAQALARTLEKRSANYNCLSESTCRYLEFDDGFKRLEFENGVITIDNENKINLIYSIIDQTFPEAATGDYIYGQSVAGHTLGTNKATAEQTLGFPVNSDSFFEYYDSLNLAFQWDAATRPLTIVARKHFNGNILIGDSINKRIGDSLLDILDTPPDPATVSDDDIINIHVPALLVKIESILHDRAVDYNCLDALPAPTCAYEVFPDQVRLDFPQGAFILNRSTSLELDIASIVNEREFEVPEEEEPQD